MKLRIEQAALADAVTRASRTLPARPPVPVLAGLKLTADTDGALTVASFNYEASTTATVTAEVADEGTVVVSGRLLADIAGALPKRSVDIALDGTTLTVAAGSARFAMPTLPLEEYPSLPTAPPELGSVSGAVLAEAISRVAPAATRDMSVAKLTGVQVTTVDGELRLGATDAYRFAAARIPWQPVLEDKEPRALIPADVLTGVVKTIAGADTVRIGMHDGLVGLAADGWTFTCRLIDDTLPDVLSKLPEDYPTTVTFQAKQFTEALKRVSIVRGDRKKQPVRLSVSEGSVTILAGSSDDATGSDEVDAAVAGEPMEVGYSPDYLAEAIRATDSETVQLNLISPVNASLIHAPGGRASYQHLVMPVRLSG